MGAFLSRFGANGQKRFISVIVCSLYTYILFAARNEFLQAFSTDFEYLIQNSRNFRLVYNGISVSLLIPSLICIFLILTNYRSVLKLNSFLTSEKLKNISKLVILLGLPVLLTLLIFPGYYHILTLFHIRLALLIPWLGLSAWISPWFKERSYPERLIFYSLLTFSLLIIWVKFTRVTNYPFSLTGSEGNNLWIFSTLFEVDKQNAQIAYFPAVAPLFWGLYGLPFLLNNLPIWLHRLWWVSLDTVAPFFILLIFCSPVKNRLYKDSLILWGGLFALMSGVYIHLLLIAGFIFAGRKLPFFARIVMMLIAGWVTVLSRWTWFPAVAFWGGLIDLFIAYPKRPGNRLIRLLPSVLVGLAGAIPGFMYVLNSQPILADLAKKSEQPLLWYRLGPNPTNNLGLILASIWTFGPILCLLLWAATKKFYKITSLETAAAVIGLVVSLIVSLLISIKIGGGDNLHNFDMFMVTILLLFGIALERSAEEWISSIKQTITGKGLLIAAIIGPCLFVASSSQFFLPDEQVTQAVLTQAKETIEASSVKGDVLFMSERQLVVFRNIAGVKMIPEYEKIAVMEHAMANDSAYFKDFYEDLKNHRFTLIVIDNIRIEEKGSQGSFGEENDAWVNWVVKPMLEYYYSAKKLEKSTFSYIWFLKPRRR